MIILKVIQALWPFLKEMVLGDKTFSQALIAHKSRLLFIGFIMLSVVLNITAIPRLFTITKEHLELVKKDEQLQKKYDALEKEKKAVPERPAPAPRPPTKKEEPVEVPAKTPKHTPKPGGASVPKPVKPTTDEERLNDLKRYFDKIKERENTTP